MNVAQVQMAWFDEFIITVLYTFHYLVLFNIICIYNTYLETKFMQTLLVNLGVCWQFFFKLDLL